MDSQSLLIENQNQAFSTTFHSSTAITFDNFARKKINHVPQSLIRTPSRSANLSSEWEMSLTSIQARQKTNIGSTTFLYRNPWVWVFYGPNFFIVDVTFQEMMLDFGFVLSRGWPSLANGKGGTEVPPLLPFALCTNEVQLYTVQSRRLYTYALLIKRSEVWLVKGSGNFVAAFDRD